MSSFELIDVTFQMHRTEQKNWTSKGSYESKSKILLRPKQLTGEIE